MRTLILAAVAALTLSGGDLCQLGFALSGSTSSRAYKNTQTACTRWILTYSGDAPVTVESSQDGSSWSTSVLSATSGTLPTTSGYGKVEINGYAPFLRVTSSGTTAQKTSGLLSGVAGLLASSVGSSVPDYVWNLGSPIAVASWTKDNALFDMAIPTGKKVVTFTYPRANAAGYGLACTTYPTPPFTLRVAVQMPTQYWSNDAAKSFAIVGRDPVATKWLVYDVARLGQYIEPKRCTGGTNPGNCTTIASYWGSPFFNNVLLNMSTNWPAVFEWKDDGTTIYASAHDPISGLSLAPFADDIPKTDKSYVTPTQLCLGLYKSNGNYTARYNLVGYSLTSP